MGVSTIYHANRLEVRTEMLPEPTPLLRGGAARAFVKQISEPPSQAVLDIFSEAEKVGRSIKRSKA